MHAVHPMIGLTILFKYPWPFRTLLDDSCYCGGGGCISSIGSGSGGGGARHEQARERCMITSCQQTAHDSTIINTLPEAPLWWWPGRKRRNDDLASCKQDGARTAFTTDAKGYRTRLQPETFKNSRLPSFFSLHNGSHQSSSTVYSRVTVRRCSNENSIPTCAGSMCRIQMSTRFASVCQLVQDVLEPFRS
jgi:hypothetical protein